MHVPNQPQLASYLWTINSHLAYIVHMTSNLIGTREHSHMPKDFYHALQIWFEILKKTCKNSIYGVFHL